MHLYRCVGRRTRLPNQAQLLDSVARPLASFQNSFHTRAHSIFQSDRLAVAGTGQRAFETFFLNEFAKFSFEPVPLRPHLARTVSELRVFTRKSTRWAESMIHLDRPLAL